MTGAPLSGADWRGAWVHRGFRLALGAGVGVTLAVVMALPGFFRWIEARPGLLINDPLLARMGPTDLSAFTFAVLYLTVAMVLVSVANRPMVVLRGLWAYVILLLLRMASMSSLTLEPPVDIIPLADPLIQNFYPGGTPFLKDLFFSGHTATLVLMALLAPKGIVRGLALLGTVLVAASVLLQHVHWTVDVLVAVPAAWASWGLAGSLLRRAGAPPGP